MKSTSHMKSKAPVRRIAKRPAAGPPARKTKQKQIVPNWTAGEG